MSGKTTNPFWGLRSLLLPPSCTFPFYSSYDLKEFIDRPWDPGSRFITQTLRSGNNGSLDCVDPVLPTGRVGGAFQKKPGSTWDRFDHVEP